MTCQATDLGGCDDAGCEDSGRCASDDSRPLPEGFAAVCIGIAVLLVAAFLAGRWSA